MSIFFRQYDFGLNAGKEVVIVRRGIIALSCLVLLVGCAYPKYNYSGEFVRTMTAVSTGYELAQPGDIVLESSLSKETRTLYVTEPVKIAFYTLMPGYYDKHGEKASGEFFYPADTGEERGVVAKAAIADPWKTIMLPKSRDKLCIITFINAKACMPAHTFEVRSRRLEHSQNDKKELIFIGVEDGQVLFETRESEANIVVPSRSKSIRYFPDDVDIRYAGFRLADIRVEEGGLRYRVLSD